MNSCAIWKILIVGVLFTFVMGMCYVVNAWDSDNANELIYNKFPSYDAISSYKGIKYTVEVENCDDGKRVTVKRRAACANSVVYFVTKNDAASPDYTITTSLGTVVPLK